MSLLYAAFCLTLWNAPASTSTIRVDWSAASGVDAPIANVRRDYVTAFNARREAMEAMYTADALAILADGAHVDAAGAAARQTNTAAAVPSVTVTLVPRKFVVSGETGSEEGTFVETSDMPDRPATVEGLYVTIYARGADGRWRIAMEVRTRGGRPPLATW